MAKLILYGQAASRTFRCFWMLKELGLEFENVPISPRKDETRTAEFLKINPNGHVPTLADGSFIIWESLAINLYLANKHPSPLTPASPEDHALALQWSLWALTELEAEVGRYLEAVQGDGGIDDDLANGSAGKLKAPLRVLDQHLMNHNWILGDSFTVADLNVAGVLSPLPYIQFYFYHNRRVIDWLRRCLIRPAAVASRIAGVASLVEEPAPI